MANNPFQEYNYLVKEDPVQHGAFIDIINKLKQGKHQWTYVGEKGLYMVVIYSWEAIEYLLWLHFLFQDTIT